AARLPPGRVRRAGRLGPLPARRLLAGLAAGGGGAGVDGDAVGDAEQPAADVLPPADRRGVAEQDEEGGLECVLGGGRVVQDAAAGGQDEPAVPPHQGGERRRVAVVAEAVDE